ncbi:hypothetical protein QBC43DRAFT_223261 [Cladorrhinum sp. PSN259]|nr:hypothetical protein QBC43DRAFT_223261 [Cladorrhinum sp. PSN259]
MPELLHPTLPTFKPTYITDEDRTRADELMTEQRRKDKKEKKIKKGEPFGYKEANPVLDDIVNDASTCSSRSPGLFEALLQSGGNVSVARPKSTNVMKFVIRKDQTQQRSDLLARATANCTIEAVRILATSDTADETSKNEALPSVIRRNEPVKSHILINAGADVEPLHQEFLDAVDKGWDEMVAVLFLGAKQPCQSCRDEGLVKAVLKGSARNLRLLLEKGADAEFKNGAALQRAMTDGRQDLVAALIASKKPPSSQSLDGALDIAYRSARMANDKAKKYWMMERCLQAGAAGVKTNQALADACKEGQEDLIDLLLAHNASVNHDSGKAIRFAVTSKQPALLTKLLQGKPSNATMAISMPFAVAVDDLDTAHSLAFLLLAANLRGDSVASALIAVVSKSLKVESPSGADTSTQDAHLNLIRLLLNEGSADVNFDSAKCLLLATQGGRSDILSLLLQHAHPSEASLNAAFPLAVALADASLRLEMATMILDAGAKGAVVDDALVASASTGAEGAALTAAIRKRSSVDYNGGAALVAAVRSRCLPQMQALLTEDACPCPATMDSAWAEADKITDSGQARLEVFKTLLTAPGRGIVSGDLQDESLAVAAAQGSYGLPICALLLEHGGASPERQDAKALVAAARGLHLGVLQLLAGSVGSDTAAAVWRRVFDAFTDDEQPEWLQPRGLEVVHFLVQHGASGDEVDAAFCKAARLYQQDAVELLATAIAPRVVDLALAFAMDSDDWKALDNRGLWLIHLLLERGVEQQYVNTEFLRAADAYARGDAPGAVIDTFTTVGLRADVNFQNGEPLQIAIRHGSVALLKKLLASGRVTKETMSLAFAEAIISTHEEAVVFSLLEALASIPGAMPDIAVPPEGYQPPLFACLAAHPQSAKLAKQLIDLNCDINAEVEHYLYDDEEVAAEPANVLAWALSLPEKKIGSAVITTLIERKANVRFTAKTSKATPLILAAKTGRGDIVAALIKAKTSVSARDCFDRSALFYASRIGDVEAVKALLKAKSPINDGSLQEAARNLHSEVVAALVKAGHSADFPSSKEQHQGRTAMQEMALMCDASSHAATAVEETLRAILKGKPRLLETSRGKNALFLALDNSHPIPITKALLDCAMWEHVNKPDNVFVTTDERGAKYFFSPTMYVSLGLSQGPRSDNEALVNLLHDKRCEDRFYAEEGAEQPGNAVGMPQNILDAERKRKDHEEKIRKKELEHQLKLLHTAQEANLKEAIERAKHEEKMFREDETARQKQENKDMLHQQDLLQKAQKAEQSQGIMASTTALKMQLQEAQEASKRRAAEARAAFELQQKERMIEVKNDGLAKEQALKLSFTEQAAKQKLALQERQHRLTAAANEQKLLTAQHMASTREIEAKRKLAIKEKQDELALRLMKGTQAEKRKVHEMKMKEMHAKGEQLKLTLLDKHFSGQSKNLKRITAS